MIMLPILLTVTLLYAAFIIWTWIGLRRLKPLESSEHQPMVTIVVVARNEEATLPGLLDSLRTQTYPADRLEIIVVDDGSSDNTWELLSRHTDQMPNLAPLQIMDVPTGWAPKKWALTRAIERARGEILLATDADCLPGPQWAEAMVSCFADRNIGLVMGPAPVMAARPGRWYEVLFLDSISMDALAAGGIGNELALTCTGRNLAYRRQVFDEVGGFAGVEHMVSGDDDLIMHKIAGAGWRIKFALSIRSTVPSPPPVGLPAFLRQRLRHASKGFAYYTFPTRPLFKALLPLLYLANVATAVSLAALGYTLQWIWLAPWAAKMAAEALLVYTYLARIQGKVRPGTFVLTGLVFPFYVTVIGLLANFYRVGWKDRRYPGTQVSKSI